MAPSRTHRLILVLITLFATIGSVPAGAEPAPDPAAERAFATLLKAYRERPALTVQTKMSIELIQGDVRSKGETVQAEFTRLRSGDGIAKLNGFTCFIDGDQFSAVHESTADAYFDQKIDGSPYWVFLLSFRDVPFPHIGLFWGEPEPEHARMQLVAKAPSIVPTGVSEIEIDGRPRWRLEFRDDTSTLVLTYDAKTNLIESAVHTITGGVHVEPGTTMITTYEFRNVVPEAPIDVATLRFDPGQRQRSATLLALVAPQAPPPGQPGLPGLPQGGTLAGSPAPAFTLATADGGAIDLEDLQGKVVVLDFWATWCGPCRRALPQLHELRTWASREDLPVVVIPVNTFESRNPADNTPDGRRAAVLAFWKDNGFTLPVAMDYSDGTAGDYGVQALPTTFVIRADGVVHWQESGFGGEYLEGLKTQVRAAIAAAAEADPEP